MNVLLWVLQISLASWNVVGGMYMMHHYEKLGNAWALNTVPGSAWIILGVLQVIFALGLILPGAKFRTATSIAGAALAAVSLLGIVLYNQYAGFPGFLWGVVPAVLAGFVAYKRWPNLPAPTGQGSPETTVKG
jgi:hypothetical protein